MVIHTNDHERNKGIQKTAFTLTNWTEDYDMDCDTAADAAIADTLGTLIRELIRQGIIKGSVATA